MMLMTQLSNLISDSLILYTIISVLDVIGVIGICVILTTTIFSLEPKMKPLPVIASALLCTCTGVIRALGESGKLGDSEFYINIELIVPFLCMTLLFFSKKVWKSYIAVLAVNLTSAVKYLILMGMPDYDFVNPDFAIEFLIEATIDIFTFAVLLAVYILYVRKVKNNNGDFSQRLPLLIILIVLTTVLFIASMVITGTGFSQERRQAYFFTLLCFPAFALTAFYATRTVIKSGIAESSYRKMLDMQLKHFTMLDEKNDELRMFRHDFPKQMAPLLMYIKDGNAAEAEKIVESFNVTIQGTRPRYNTGNPQLDTVLECQQQFASKHGVKIDVLQGSTFPVQGIRSEDIYTIFPNALDNAVEACASLGGNAVVSFESHINGNMVFVRITNPYDGNLKIGADGLKTRKADKEKHGFGIRSMKKAMSHYGSENLFYETKNGRVTLNLVFKLDNSTD